MMPRSCEVLIVGGGPAGLVLACLLAERGVDVVVIERRTQPRQYSRAIGLHPPALAVLKMLGVEEAALAQGTRVHSGTAYSRGNQLGSLSFEQAWPDRPYVLTLPQNHTEVILAQRLAQLAPAALHSGWEVTQIVDQSAEPAKPASRSGVHVTARATDGIEDEAVEMSWQADIVVGADGPRSLVRKTASIATRSRPLKDTYVMGDFAQHTTDDEVRAATTAEIFLETTGVVESFPLPGRMRRWVAHTDTELATESPLVLTELIAERTGITVNPMSSTMVSAFHVRRRIAERMVMGRCIIIGDAAHEVSPIGGQGMTLGWLDAIELAPLLTQYLTDQLPASLQQLAIFHNFERKRLVVARAAARQAELNMMLGRPMSTSAAVLRDAVLKTVLTTSLQNRLARAFTMRQPLGAAEIHVPR